jgi:hypothetical protein
LTHSHNSHRGVQHVQAAHHDSPHLMEERRRKLQHALEDVRAEGLLAR